MNAFNEKGYVFVKERLMLLNDVMLLIVSQVGNLNVWSEKGYVFVEEKDYETKSQNLLLWELVGHQGD